jgi:hypothetical protein
MSHNIIHTLSHDTYIIVQIQLISINLISVHVYNINYNNNNIINVTFKSLKCIFQFMDVGIYRNSFIFLFLSCRLGLADENLDFRRF